MSAPSPDEPRAATPEGEVAPERWDHLCTIGFSVLSDDEEGPTDAEYRAGLLARIAALDANPCEWADANGDRPTDTIKARS